jgi:uncharacterized protein with NAD-binding domain and iron-sulfur cluster
MSVRVLVLGGGVGGLSTAHELVERGFQVSVVEQRNVPGGKARSLLVPDSAVPPNAPLPGEHGFRFFPHFYRHIIDTMARTPVGGGRMASDQLVYASREMLAVAGYPPMSFPAHKPGSAGEFLADLLGVLMDLPTLKAVGLVESDFTFFIDRVWRLMTACPDRALHEYENLSWWDFMQADTHSAAFRQFFVEGLTRCLVAARADLANTRAGGVVLTQLVYGSFADSPSFDRLLNGPTSQVWIEPWRAYLVSRGVEFQWQTSVTGIECDGKRITGVQTQAADGGQRTQSADFYVCALPIEYTAPLLNPAVLAAAPGLAGILAIAGNVYDMTGIQFYLSQDAPLVNGHLLFADSPWALTGISQRQFWAGIDFAHLGDGHTGGILSVDISDWDAPGVCVVNEQAPPGPDGKKPYKTARQCTPDEVALETWTQMRSALIQADGTCPLPLMHPRFFIDPGMVFDPMPVSNNSRLFVNQVHSWEHRPEAVTQIPNFFLASDYVRTNTNLATMEAANEAARRAVNGLIKASGVLATPCQIWPLPVPIELEPFILWDQLQWDLGKPWSGQRA